VSNAPSKPVSFSRPKVGYFSNRPRMLFLCLNKNNSKTVCTYVGVEVQLHIFLTSALI